MKKNNLKKIYFEQIIVFKKITLKKMTLIKKLILKKMLTLNEKKLTL